MHNKICPCCDNPISFAESIIHESFSSTGEFRIYKDSGMRYYYHTNGTMCGKNELGEYVRIR